MVSEGLTQVGINIMEIIKGDGEIMTELEIIVETEILEHNIIIPSTVTHIMELILDYPMQDTGSTTEHILD